MNPRQYLYAVGGFSVLISVLGFAGVVGPTPKDSIFGESWWFDHAENTIHTALGILLIGAAIVLSPTRQALAVLLFGVVSLFFGLYSVVTPNLPLTNLENPADTLLHLIEAVWALALLYAAPVTRRLGWASGKLRTP